MATIESVAPNPLGAEQQQVTNDMSIQVATVNGSGSQTANTVLLRTIMQMGIPASGKSIFPSNIAGLPSWFTIRASRDGYVARKKEIDYLLAMNPETAREDVLNLAPGAVVVYDEPLRLRELREGLIFYAVPFDKLVLFVCPDAKLRKLVRNMLYVGVLVHLLDFEMPEVESALRKQFGKKLKAAELNWNAVEAGFSYAQKNLPKADGYHLQRMSKSPGKILIDGNTAAAIGCVFAGVTVASWYPITPSSSLPEALTDYMKKYRIDPKTGKATFAIIQAEDELAALGMLIGAGWAGSRAMTATSGPGISLMAEFTGLAYYAEVPVVIFDVQRVGPSTGLPTRTSQGDILCTAYLSHGDTAHIMLFPASVEECYTMAMEACDLAEEFQTPVFVMTDLDLGNNNWVADPFLYPEKSFRRGKVLTAEELERLEKFERYRDVDGDGICYRTLPGTDHPLAAYFCRGTGHNEKAGYSERPEDYKNNVDRLRRKHDTARQRVPPPVMEEDPAAEIGIIAYGSTHWACVESRDQLWKERNLRASYLRIRAFPFNEEVTNFVKRMKRVYVVEQNRDGQMRDLIRLAVCGEDCVKLRRVCYYTGIPIDARTVTDEILSQELRLRQ